VCAYTPALQTHSQTPIFTPIYIKFRVSLSRGVRQTSGETPRPAVRRSLPARATAGVSAYRRCEVMPSLKSRLHSTSRAHLRHSCFRELVSPTDRAPVAAGCVPSALQQCAISHAGACLPHRRLASLNRRMGRARPPATLLAGRCRGPGPQKSLGSCSTSSVAACRRGGLQGRQDTRSRPIRKLR
jgi:hypothetical protein